ncbi:hypothetical protein N431DRAFT_360981 [Stipitochalara longipes BDJ]|nr:hypothetical protein N431DRAFT_360981 [Stipitochalara longipes BDJ]
MPSSSPDQVLANWHGIIDHDLFTTIRATFGLASEDSFVYRAEAFTMTLAQIQEQVATGKLKYKYRAHGHPIEVPPADITAYTSIFSASTDTSKALTSFHSNAKKGSPRAIVADYLQSRRISLFKIPKSKAHINPYYDLWVHSCQITTFLGPLPDPSYSHPINAKRTHPLLPVFYHHFGCVVPSWEALNIIAQLGEGGVIDMASGNGYWTYMLRRMKVDVTAVDNMASEYRTMWISDTVKADGVDYLKKNAGGKGKLLLMVYVITAGTFSRRLLNTYRGDIIVVVGTQNSNRYTGFSDCTAEEYFKEEMPGWTLLCRIPLPSFAGKDEALFVWNRTTGNTTR